MSCKEEMIRPLLASVFMDGYRVAFRLDVYGRDRKLFGQPKA